MDLCRVIEWLCNNWDQADDGIWEVRSGRQQFTFSRVMSWVAPERAIRMALDRGLTADLLVGSGSATVFTTRS